ncbi:hypothetical protein [Chryseobacterium indoltheticum]|uniref:hypothetical protein n=1 Tax=Chryseobacterium indoltheticum TaxID=254 RepID=UPI003F49884F
MIFAENNIASAGNLVFKNSEIVELGKFEAIDTSQFNFVRKIDFCAEVYCSVKSTKKEI